MNTISLQQMRELSEHSQKNSVSLYMPTHRTGREIQQDPIRLKNLLRQAEEQLIDNGMEKSAVDKMLSQVTDSIDKDSFWEHSLDGLAIYCSLDQCQFWRVPLDFNECVHVGEKYFIKPLLPMLDRNKSLLILALSQDSARLYDTTPDQIEEIELPEIRKIEVDGNQQALQFHSHASAGPSGATDVAMYHGQGGPDDRAETDILNFFHRVDKAVTSELGNSQKLMALACVGYLAPLYKRANSYKELIEAVVPGNPDRLQLEQLREHAWEVAEPHLAREKRQLLGKFQSETDSEHIAADVTSVTLAACQGRIDTLFLRAGADCQGLVDMESNQVEVQEQQTQESVDLLDHAAHETLRYGGHVYTTEEIPDINSPMAALLRH